MIPFPIALRNITEPCGQLYDWFSYCLRHFDELREAPLPKWPDSLVSEELQPVWDTNDPFSEIDREELPSSNESEKSESISESIEQRKPPDDSEEPEVTSEESMDVLAWYAPWHRHITAEYGIYLPAVGIGVMVKCCVQGWLRRRLSRRLPELRP
jgi:hypothetical protein